MLKDRPDTLWSTTKRIKTGYGSLYVTITAHVDWGHPVEVFATIGKSGKSVEAKAEAIGRLVSLALRYNVPVVEIVAQLKDIEGEQPIMTSEGLIKSIPDAVAIVLDQYMKTSLKAHGMEATADAM